MNIVTCKSVEVTNASSALYGKHVATLTYDKDYIITSVGFKRLANTAGAPFDPYDYMELNTPLLTAGHAWPYWCEEEIVQICLANDQPVIVRRTYSNSADAFYKPRYIDNITLPTTKAGFVIIDSITPALADITPIVSDPALDPYVFTQVLTPENASEIFYLTTSDQHGHSQHLLTVPALDLLYTQRPVSIPCPAGVGTIVYMNDPFMASAVIADSNVQVPTDLPVLTYQGPLGTVLIDSNGVLNLQCVVEVDTVCKLVFLNTDGSASAIRVSGYRYYVSGVEVTRSCSGNVVEFPSNSDGPGMIDIYVTGYTPGYRLYDNLCGTLELRTINGVLVNHYKVYAQQTQNLAGLMTFNTTGGSPRRDTLALGDDGVWIQPTSANYYYMNGTYSILATGCKLNIILNSRRSIYEDLIISFHTGISETACNTLVAGSAFDVAPYPIRDAADVAVRAHLYLEDLPSMGGDTHIKIQVAASTTSTYGVVFKVA